jgi:hypothetical protein
MCKQTIAMGNRKRIGSLICLPTNRARNRTAIRTQIRTRVDGPLLLAYRIITCIFRLEFQKQFLFQAVNCFAGINSVTRLLHVRDNSVAHRVIFLIACIMLNFFHGPKIRIQLSRLRVSRKIHFPQYH